MSYLPPPEKSIVHLRNKIKQGKFYVNDYDKSCIDSIISFYNTVEEKIRIEYKDYYHLFSLIMRYEITLNRLRDNKNISILEILDKVEAALVNPNHEFEQVNLMLEAQSQKFTNFRNKEDEANMDSIFTDKDENRLRELINKKIDYLILKKSTINNAKK